MRITDYKRYTQDKSDFIHKQNSDWKVETSPLEGKTWYKIYIFENGATFYERYERKTIEKTIEVIPQLKTKVSVDVLEVEYWNSEDSESKLYYENW